MTSGLRVAFVTLGCKVNQAETEEMARLVAGTGAILVPESDADVVVVVTCTVTAEADRKGRKAVHHALALPQEPWVVVTGCMAAVSGGELAGLGGRVVVEPDKSRVAARVMALAGAQSGVKARVTQSAPVAEDVQSEAECACGPAPPVASLRTRAQVKVEDGCDALCAYCIVPYARGLPESVPLDAVVKRVAELVVAGTGEVVLTGINIGRYNWRGARLPDLVSAVAETGVVRIRLSSIEPDSVTPELLETAAATPAFCRHLHIPLQSGSDTVLARMGRPYTTAQYAEILALARSALPGLAVTTDVIAGFPGETDAEHAETLAFIESAEFARLHVFRYSCRRGTRAAALPDHVAPAVRSTRAAGLRSLGTHLMMEHARSLVGGTADVLIERVSKMPNGGLVAEGLTGDYSRVAVIANAGMGAHPLSAGTIVRVALTGLTDDGRLIGTRRDGHA